LHTAVDGVDEAKLDAIISRYDSEAKPHHVVTYVRDREPLSRVAEILHARHPTVSLRPGSGDHPLLLSELQSTAKRVRSTSRAAADTDDDLGEIDSEVDGQAAHDVEDLKMGLTSLDKDEDHKLHVVMEHIQDDVLRTADEIMPNLKQLSRKYEVENDDDE